MDWVFIISILAALSSSVFFVSKGALIQKIGGYKQNAQISLGTPEHIRTLFEQFASSGVTILSFDQNDQIEEIPEEISLVTTVEELYINNLPILTLPLEIGDLPVLRIIDIRGSFLQEIPPQIANLHSLTELRLPHNQIVSIPVEIANLPSLRVLELSGNPISNEKIEELRNLMPNTEIIFENL